MISYLRLCTHAAANPRLVGVNFEGMPLIPSKCYHWLPDGRSNIARWERHPIIITYLIYYYPTITKIVVDGDERRIDFIAKQGLRNMLK